MSYDSSSALRRRIVQTLNEEDRREENKKGKIQESSGSASSLMFYIYGGFFCFLLAIIFLIMAFLQPSLFYKIYDSVRPLPPLVLVGVYPRDLSPSRSLPAVVGKYALCTPENLVTRRAIQFKQQQQTTLSSPRAKVIWALSELQMPSNKKPFDAHLSTQQVWSTTTLNMLQSRCLGGARVSIQVFVTWSRYRQVDYWNWCQLLGKAGGILQYQDGFEAVSYLPSVRTNIVIQEGNSRILSNFLVLHDHGIVEKVLSWISKSSASDDERYRNALESFLFEIVQPLLSTSGWFVGKSICKDSEPSADWRLWAHDCRWKQENDHCCDIYFPIHYPTHLTNLRGQPE